jgi:hypothetical protein
MSTKTNFIGLLRLKKEANIKKTTKFGGKSLMVCGCLTGEGVSELIRVNVNVDSAEYVRILSTGFINTMEKFSLDTKDVLFIQDLATLLEIQING